MMRCGGKLAAGLSLLLLAACATSRSAADLLITDPWVHDGSGADPVRAHVAVKDGRFLAIGEKLRALRTIDGSGLHLVPGLIDMHVHVAAVAGETVPPGEFLRRGITTVRDLGGFPAGIRSALALADGPRIHSAITTLNGEAMAPFHRPVASDAEARAAVADLAQAGAAVIKIHRAFKPALLPTLVAAAREKNLGVTGHIPLGLHPLRACELGMAGVEHVGSFVEAYVSAVPGAKQEDAIRYLLAAEAEPLYRCLAQRGVFVTPTLVLYESIAKARSGNGPIAPRFRDFIAQLQAIALRLHRAGVRLLPGSDASGLDQPAVAPGESLLRELELLQEAGLTGRELMRIAAANPAQALRIGAAGKLVGQGLAADFLILAADPRASAAAYSAPLHIFRAGQPVVASTRTP